MISAAQGVSPRSSQSAQEQRAIATDEVEESEQKNQPQSPPSCSSLPPESQAEGNTSQNPAINLTSAVNGDSAANDGAASQSNAVSNDLTAPTSQASANALEVAVTISATSNSATSSSTTNNLTDNGDGEASTVISMAGDTPNDEEESFPDDPLTDEDNAVIAPPLLPQNDIATATELEAATFELSGCLGTNAADLYQFTVEETGIFTATLDNLNANADVQLIQDKNGNGQIDAGEIVAWEWEQGSNEESIRHFLQAGNYVVRVLHQDITPEPTDYRITSTFQAAETDDRAFSINVVYQRSVDQLNEQARDAIERAADYWENIISHSSFDRPLDFALGIYGITTDPQSSFLAYAGPYSYRNTGETDNENTEDRLLPVVGFAVLNNSYFEEYNATPDYLESVLRHEIGHALGLGILWNQGGNDLLDPDTGVYRAETYAGQSYGELLGTGVATEIPLDPNSLTHWDEDTFDAELMTPRAEGIGEPLPLSPLTISSLRDLGWHVNYGAADAFSLESNAIA